MGEDLALKVLSAGAVQGVVEPVAAAFGRETGRRMELAFNTVGATRARIAAGEAADLVIISSQAAETLQAALPHGAHVLGRVGMGLAVRDGAQAPDIASVDAFRQTLLAARSLAYTDPAAGGTGGIYFANLLQRLGLADAIRPKAVLATGGHDVARRVASGAAEIGVTIISEIAAVPGATLAAPLPAELQTYTTYVAAVPATSRDRALAERLIRTLTGASVSALWTAAGFEPPDGTRL